MSAFVIFHSTVKDPAKFQAYAQSVAPTLKDFGGEVILRGKASAVLAGDHAHQAVGVLKFPDVGKISNWYNSAAYQELIGNRDEGADVVAISYAEPVN